MDEMRMKMNRRSFTLGAGSAAFSTSLLTGGCATFGQTGTADREGCQRLNLSRLKKWESLGYGMFIHFGMSTFVEKEIPGGAHPPSLYAPDRLDVDQWVSVARDAGMKYAVLTTKHVAGHCLWPSRHTDYTVAASPNTTDVVEKFVEACDRRGVLPGFYYCSWDNHHKFGSMTPTDIKWTEVMNRFPKGDEELAPFTTSLYQSFQTAQIEELVNEYGPILEMWVDIPGVLGRGYRTFLYNHVADLQPDIVIMMNSGIGTGEDYPVDYAWPADLIAIERRVPPESGHRKWRTIEGKRYYMPGELCDPIGKKWFYVPDDFPRPDDELLELFNVCRERGVNFLLDVPPDKHGVIPKFHVDALMRLRRNAGI